MQYSGALVYRYDFEKIKDENKIFLAQFEVFFKDPKRLFSNFFIKDYFKNLKIFSNFIDFIFKKEIFLNFFSGNFLNFFNNFFSSFFNNLNFTNYFRYSNILQTFLFLKNDFIFLNKKLKNYV